jgi:uncharacterized protein (DUF1501 family)
MTSPDLTRRRFLQSMAAAGGALTLGGGDRLWAVPAAVGTPLPQSGGSQSLVVLFLRGGADVLNMVVPYGDQHFEAWRPTLSSTLADGLLKIDDTWALHPALSPLRREFDAGMFAPIVCSGSNHATRSHFDAQDWMEFAAPGDRSVREGWVNRYLAATATEGASEFRALGLQQLLPRSFRGQYPVLAVPRNVGRRRSGKTLDRFEDFYGDGTMLEGGDMMMGPREDDAAGVVDSGRATIETLRRFQQIVAAGERESRIREESAGAGTVTVAGATYPEGRFGQSLRTLSVVLKADEGVQVAGIDYGGWDDHAQEGAIEGRMADRMGDLASGLSAFAADLGPRMAHTTVLVMSEFGRTVRENGNNGTDHGHGTTMFVLGGGVKGGKVHGDWRGLATDALYQGRDLPVTTDFRDVFHTVLANGLGFESPKEFFPGYRPTELKGLY